MAKETYWVIVVALVIAFIVWAVWLRLPKVAKIELSVEPATLVADNESIAVITAVLFDAEGKPIPNRVVKFELSPLT